MITILLLTGTKINVFNLKIELKLILYFRIFNVQRKNSLVKMTFTISYDPSTQLSRHPIYLKSTISFYLFYE